MSRAHTVLHLMRLMLLSVMRTKLYVGVLGAGVMFILIGAVTFELAVGEEVNAFFGLSLFALGLVLDALCVGAAFTLTETFLTGRIAEPFLVRPRSGPVLLAAALCAQVCTATGTAIVLAALFAVASATYHVANTGISFLAALIQVGEALMISLVAIALRLRLSQVPTLLGVVACWVVGRSSEVVHSMVDRDAFGAVTPLARLAQHLVPQLSLFDGAALFVARTPVDGYAQALAFCVPYCVGLAALVVLAHTPFARSAGDDRYG